MAYSQKEFALEYLEEHYTTDLNGMQLAEALNVPPRSARRYLSEYKQLISSPAERLKIAPMMMNAVVFDIETTDFGTEGYAGHLICCSFLDLQTNKIETLKIEFEDHGDDRKLLVAVAKKLAQYPFHVGHNIASFDYNWLNSRLCFHHLPILNTSCYFDTYQVAKSMALKTSKSLGNLIDYFGLEGIKTTIYRSSWSKVMSPYQVDFDDAISEIVYHCEQDVLANRKLLDVLHYYSFINTRANPWKRSKMSGNYWGQE